MQIFFLRATGRCAFFKLRYYRLRQYWIFHKILRKLRGIYRKRLPCLLPLNSNATKSQHELIQKSKQQNNPQVTLKITIDSNGLNSANHCSEYWSTISSNSESSSSFLACLFGPSDFCRGAAHVGLKPESAFSRLGTRRSGFSPETSK